VSLAVALALATAITSISDLRSFRQRRDLHRGTSWRLIVEIGAVDFVHDLEIAGVSEKDVGYIIITISDPG
jgi:hypothetical protein